MQAEKFQRGCLTAAPLDHDCVFGNWRQMNNLFEEITCFVPRDRKDRGIGRAPGGDHPYLYFKQTASPGRARSVWCVLEHASGLLERSGAEFFRYIGRVVPPQAAPRSSLSLFGDQGRPVETPQEGMLPAENPAGVLDLVLDCRA